MTTLPDHILITDVVNRYTSDRMTKPVKSRAMISVIDDDASLREALGGLLRSAGFETEVFASAAEFLDAERQRTSACVVLDVRMPGMTGLELQQQLIASGRNIPIVFISAHGNDEVRALVLERGAADFLQKPFTKGALLGAIAKARATAAPSDP